MGQAATDQESALHLDPVGRDEYARLWRDRRFDRMECLSARFNRHTYAPHTHDTYVIGVILAGTELFHHRGVEHAARAGSVAVLNPGELHDGRPSEHGYAYRMFYPSVALLERELSDALGRPAAAPNFTGTLVEDPELFRAIRDLHLTLEDPQADPLKTGTDLMRAFVAVSLRHGEAGGRLRPAGQEPAAVRRAREYLDAHLDRPVELADLADAVGLSRFHLLRVFRSTVGTTPHGYLTDRRVQQAKELLSGDLPLAEVAVACGFCDQAHLNRVFKARVGVAPGQYRRGSNPVQDGAPAGP